MGAGLGIVSPAVRSAGWAIKWHASETHRIGRWNPHPQQAPVTGITVRTSLPPPPLPPSSPRASRTITTLTRSSSRSRTSPRYNGPLGRFKIVLEPQAGRTLGALENHSGKMWSDMTSVAKHFYSCLGERQKQPLSIQFFKLFF